MSLTREVSIGNRVIKFEFQKFAKQANGSVMVSCGGTQVLVTACASDDPIPDAAFLPLAVEYIEKAYAAGRIPGGYNKREGKPSDAAALAARVIDRPLRPSFPKGYAHETVVAATIMSYEHGCSPAPLALLGASAALMISEIPFNGPIASLRVGRVNGEFVIDPLEGDLQGSDLDLNIACRPDAVLMVEAGAKFLSEDEMLAGIRFAHEAMQPLFELQYEVQKEIGKTKWEVPTKEFNPELVERVQAHIDGPLAEALAVKDKMERGRALKAMSRQTVATLNPEGDAATEKEIKGIVDHLKGRYMRSRVLSEKIRIDGRGPKDIRPIACEVGTLHRPHGSALFTRGETQSLASAVLASDDSQQRSESLWNTDMRERFMLHYNFPPFSVGEARMQRHPNRREIGHGALARRALFPILPTKEDFGYTVRLVSETLESNGSSSMAAVCSGTMAMMNAGIPLKAPVAGIAMGLIKEGDDHVVLSDILGDEDHLGDMDFKVCGTEEGITALQMDIKIGGISDTVMAEALQQAREGRIHILGKMAEAIAEPEGLSGKAPRIFKVKIRPDKIRDLIGPSGKNIKKITAETGVKIDVDDSGMVGIVAPDVVAAQAAKAMIRSVTTTSRVGDICLGKITRIVDFGAFLEIRPGVEGLCHISQFEDERIENIDDVAKVGDELMVKIVDIDRQGRMKLSRREALGQRPTQA